jgi:hypothetical protein
MVRAGFLQSQQANGGKWESIEINGNTQEMPVLQ